MWAVEEIQPIFPCTKWSQMHFHKWIPKDRNGFQTVLKRYIPPVSDSFLMFRIMMTMTHNYNKVTGIMIFLTRYAVNTGWWEIGIQDCYSLVKIAIAPICACKNNRRIWRHNASASGSRDVRDQPWWRQNAKSRKHRPWRQWRNER